MPTWVAACARFQVISNCQSDLPPTPTVCRANGNKSNDNTCLVLLHTPPINANQILHQPVQYKSTGNGSNVPAITEYFVEQCFSRCHFGCFTQCTERAQVLLHPPLRRLPAAEIIQNYQLTTPPLSSNVESTPN